MLQDKIHCLIFTLLCVMKISVVVNGTNNIDSKIFTCFERTNLTVIVSGLRYFDSGKFVELLNDLEAPCRTIFIFIGTINKAVPWERGGQLFENHQNTLVANASSNMALVAFIEDVLFYQETRQHNQNPKNNSNANMNVLNVKQTVLAIQDPFVTEFGEYVFGFSNAVLKALEALDRETRWKVIILCEEFFCPRSRHLPIRRIVPFTGRTKPFISKLNGIIQNPDFNQMEYLEHASLSAEDEPRLKCLAHKTFRIRIQYNAEVSLITLLENLAILIYNTRGLSTRFVLYGNVFTAQIGENGFDREFFEVVTNKRINVEIIDTLDEPQNGDIYLIEGASSSFVYYKDIICSKGNRSKKTFVFYFNGEQPEEMNRRWHKECVISQSSEKENIGVSPTLGTRKQIKSKHKFRATFRQYDPLYVYSNFIEEILSIACQ